jgi:hypothetical protein
VLEGTRGCGITGSGTTRVRFDISRALGQDLELKEPCHKAQDDLSSSRSNGAPSGFRATVVRERATVHYPFRIFSPFKS